MVLYLFFYNAILYRYMYGQIITIPQMSVQLEKHNVMLPYSHKYKIVATENET